MSRACAHSWRKGTQGDWSALRTCGCVWGRTTPRGWPACLWRAAPSEMCCYTVSHHQTLPLFTHIKWNWLSAPRTTTTYLFTFNYPDCIYCISQSHFRPWVFPPDLWFEWYCVQICLKKKKKLPDTRVLLLCCQVMNVDLSWAQRNFPF